jgi:cytochrome P450
VRPLQVDPYSDEFQQSPFAAYAELRATAPVYQVPDHGFYLVTTHALVREVLHDPVTYANSVTSARRTEPPPEIAEQIAAIQTQGSRTSRRWR